MSFQIDGLWSNGLYPKILFLSTDTGQPVNFDVNSYTAVISS